MAGTESDANVMSFTKSSGHMALKSRQAVGVATGGAVAGAHRRFGAKVNGVCDDFMKLRLSSGGCETRSARGQSAWDSVAGLATGVATRPARVLAEAVYDARTERPRS